MIFHSYASLPEGTNHMLTSRVIPIQKNSLTNGTNDVGSKTNIQEVSDVKSIGLLTVPILIQNITHSICSIYICIIWWTQKGLSERDYASGWSSFSRLIILFVFVSPADKTQVEVSMKRERFPSSFSSKSGYSLWNLHVRYVRFLKHPLIAYLVHTMLPMVGWCLIGPFHQPCHAHLNSMSIVTV